MLWSLECLSFVWMIHLSSRYFKFPFLLFSPELWLLGFVWVWWVITFNQGGVWHMYAGLLGIGRFQYSLLLVCHIHFMFTLKRKWNDFQNLLIIVHLVCPHILKPMVGVGRTLKHMKTEDWKLYQAKTDKYEWSKHWKRNRRKARWTKNQGQEGREELGVEGIGDDWISHMMWLTNTALGFPLIAIQLPPCHYGSSRYSKGENHGKSREHEAKARILCLMVVMFHFLTFEEETIITPIKQQYEYPTPSYRILTFCMG